MPDNAVIALTAVSKYLFIQIVWGY